MPKALEHKLEIEARHKGFKKGSDRYNRYVYGTMNIIEHNKAGGPEKVFSSNPIKMRTGESTHPRVHGVHIGVTIAILVLLWYFFFRERGFISTPSPAQVNPWVPTSPYPGFASYSGWISAQYNSLGANAGALDGQAT